MPKNAGNHKNGEEIHQPSCVCLENNRFMELELDMAIYWTYLPTLARGLAYQMCVKKLFDNVFHR